MPFYLYYKMFQCIRKLITQLLALLGSGFGRIPIFTDDLQSYIN